MGTGFKVTSNFFKTGMTFHQFVERATENKSHFENLYNQIQIPKEKIPSLELIGLKAPNWLLIGDDWCIDCVAFVPVVARLAEASKAKLKLFKRSDHIDLAETYKHHNKIKTPILVFFNENFKEVGRWIERPRVAQRYVNALGRENQKKAKEISGKTGENYEEVLKSLKEDMKKKLFTAYRESRYTNNAIEEMISILEYGISK